MSTVTIAATKPSPKGRWLFPALLVLAMAIGSLESIGARNVAMDAHGFAVGLMVFFVLFFDMLPALLAGKRGHHNFMAILMLTALAGWTVIGWIAAMVWACTEVRRGGS